MIEIKPITDNHFRCPECSSANPEIIDIHVHSIYSMGECRCRYCNLEFYQTLPIGHCVDDYVSVRKPDGKIYPGVNPDFWLIDVVAKARNGRTDRQVAVRKIINESKKEVVVLNTLDYLYGHALLKLFNYQHHLRTNPNLGLIVIVPKAFEWLVPAGVSEAWIVDLSLSELAYEHADLDAYFKKEFERFDRIWFSMAWSHPDLTAIDIKQMTGIEPFNLDLFTSEPPTITFVVREDRWWMRSKLEYWAYRLGRRFPVIRKFLYGMVTNEQNKLVEKTIGKIKEQLPNARFFVTGLGEKTGFGRLAMDSRTLKVNEEKELEWCRIYSHSHVVIGFHGSNMLLPTAFAAGCVEILPEDRYGNILQDIAVRYGDRRQSYFYRFADQYSTPSSIASKVVAMIRDYESFEKNMCRNHYGKGTEADLFMLQR